MISRKEKYKNIYNKNIGVKVGNFSHPYSRKEGQVAMGVVCGYSESDIVVKLLNCEGWDEAGIKKSGIFAFIEPESKNHNNGYWFISNRELKELSIAYDY